MTASFCRGERETNQITGVVCAAVMSLWWAGVGAQMGLEKGANDARESGREGERDGELSGRVGKLN